MSLCLWSSVLDLLQKLIGHWPWENCVIVFYPKGTGKLEKKGENRGNRSQGMICQKKRDSSVCPENLPAELLFPHNTLWEVWGAHLRVSPSRCSMSSLEAHL